MRKQAIFFLLFGTALSFFYPQEKIQVEKPRVFVHMEYRALHPGEVVKVTAKVSFPAKTAQMRFEGKSYPMGKGNGSSEFLALLGLDLGLDPGEYPLEIAVFFQDGKNETARKEIKIISKDFPVKRLWVEERYVTPPVEVQERIQREADILHALYEIYTPEWMGRGNFIVPSEGEVKPNFGERRIFNGKPRSSHGGVDISSPMGSPVKASNTGRVVLASDLYFAGKTVIIDHGLGLFSLYCHLSEILVKRGQIVARGERIGKIGATGRVTGPHLHWGFKASGCRVDPFSLLSLGF